MSKKIGSIIQSFLYTLSYPLAQLLGGIIYTLIATVWIIVASNSADTLISSFDLLKKNIVLISAFSSAILLLVYAIIYGFRGAVPKKLFNLKRISLGKAAVSVFAGLSVYNLVVLVLGLLAILLPQFTQSLEQHNQLLQPLFDNVWISILCVGIFMPVLEELFFRGIILRVLKKHLRPVWFILISAVMFGLVHMNITSFNLLQPAYAFLIGVVLAILCHRFDSILAPIFAHIAFNLSSAVLTFFIEPLSAQNQAVEIILSSVLILSSLLAPLAIFLIYRLSRKETTVLE